MVKRYSQGGGDVEGVEPAVHGYVHGATPSEQRLWQALTLRSDKDRRSSG